MTTITEERIARLGWERVLKLDLYAQTNLCVCEQWKCPHRDQQWDPVFAGRCRSGKRWFWSLATSYGWADNNVISWGREDTELTAVRAIAEELVSLDGNRKVGFGAGCASSVLKQLNKEARAERIATKPPSDGTDTVHTEHLYTLFHRCWDTCQEPDDPYGRSPDHQCYQILTYPITKTTATRFYFTDGYGRSYYIPRSAFDADGRAYHAKVRETLSLTPPEIPSRRQRIPAQRTENLTELRKAMADAHPDRGGDRDSFQAARRAYLAAKAGAR